MDEKTVMRKLAAETAAELGSKEQRSAAMTQTVLKLAEYKRAKSIFFAYGLIYSLALKR